VEENHVFVRQNNRKEMLADGALKSVDGDFHRN
jgi:hypothetical protein